LRSVEIQSGYRLAPNDYQEHAEHDRGDHQGGPLGNREAERG
jgi:hypothetical protein